MIKRLNSRLDYDCGKSLFTTVKFFRLLYMGNDVTKGKLNIMMLHTLIIVRKSTLYPCGRRHAV